MAKRKTFEDALNRLEEIVEQMEDNETDLDKAVKLYTEGVELSAFCSEKLNTAEQKVTLLKESADGSFKKSTFEVKEDKYELE